MKTHPGWTLNGSEIQRYALCFTVIKKHGSPVLSERSGIRCFGSTPLPDAADSLVL